LRATIKEKATSNQNNIKKYLKNSEIPKLIDKNINLLIFQIFIMNKEVKIILIVSFIIVCVIGLE